MNKNIWDGDFKPTKIFGNLYFVGTVPASVHIVDTGDGLIVFDTGYDESLDLVIEHIQEIGFSVNNIKSIFITHGHIDHMGGAKRLKELCGAKIYLGKEDEKSATGAKDLSFAKELGMEFTQTFVPDVLIDDGDVFTMGNTTVRAVATPGHTLGAMSYFFNVTDGNETFIAGLHGGMGVNSLTTGYLINHNLPFELRSDYANSMNRLSKEKVDIFLGNHMQHNHTEEKSKQLKYGNLKAFVNPNEWKEYNLWCLKYLKDMIENENK